MEIQEEKDADLTGKQQDVFHVGTPTLGIEIQALIAIYVTSFSSISYYSNVRLVSKIELEQNFQSTILDVHASANERPPIPNSCLKLSFWSSTRDKKGYPIYQITIHEPYPEPNGGQLIRRARDLVRSNRYIDYHNFSVTASLDFRAVFDVVQINLLSC